MFEVAHTHGQCSSSPADRQNRRPSIAEILSTDQARVDHILARLKSSLRNELEISDNTITPAWSGIPLGVGNYIACVGLGTPPHNHNVIIDTGSDITWTRNNLTEVVNASYSQIMCGSNICREYINPNSNCSEQEPDDQYCLFTIQYGDGSIVSGIIVRDNFTITTEHDQHDDDDEQEEVYEGFLFGYVDQVDHPLPSIFGTQIDGLLGLSRGKLSFGSQTKQRSFSYCLPSNENTIGFLKLGNGAGPSSLSATNFTPLMINNIPDDDLPFYLVEITSISVDGKKLPVSNLRSLTAIIDSGTVITRLPTDIYIAMRDKFDQNMMANNYTKAPAVELLDTCYNTSNVVNMSIPTISFTFNGKVAVELDPSGILYAIDESKACLAFADADDSDHVIFGNTQQRTFEVVFDVPKERLGFRRNACN